MLVEGKFWGMVRDETGALSEAKLWRVLWLTWGRGALFSPVIHLGFCNKRHCWVWAPLCRALPAVWRVHGRWPWRQRQVCNVDGSWKEQGWGVIQGSRIRLTDSDLLVMVRVLRSMTVMKHCSKDSFYWLYHFLLYDVGFLPFSRTCREVLQHLGKCWRKVTVLEGKGQKSNWSYKNM